LREFLTGRPRPMTAQVSFAGSLRLARTEVRNRWAPLSSGSPLIWVGCWWSRENPGRRTRSQRLPKVTKGSAGYPQAPGPPQPPALASDYRAQGHPMASRPGAQGRPRPEHRKRRGRTPPPDAPGGHIQRRVVRRPGAGLAAKREGLPAYLDFLVAAISWLRRAEDRGPKAARAALREFLTGRPAL
jgi:hypothetical protein